jgi:hypothetical protein
MGLFIVLPFYELPVKAICTALSYLLGMKRDVALTKDLLPHKKNTHYCRNLWPMTFMEEMYFTALESQDL